jgi:hypothetical protein
LSAQSPTGSIVGTVIDAQGLPIEGANVTLTNLGTNYNYTSATSSNGAYQFQSIDYGLYRVSVTRQVGGENRPSKSAKLLNEPRCDPRAAMSV